MLLLQCEYFIPSTKWCIINWVVQSCYFKQIIWIPLSDFTLTWVSRPLNQTLAQNLWWNLWYSSLTSASFWYFMLLEKGMWFSFVNVSTELASLLIRNPPSFRKKAKVPKTQEAQKIGGSRGPSGGTLWDPDGVLCSPSRAAQWGVQLLWSSVLPEMGFLVMQVPLRFPCPGK